MQYLTKQINIAQNTEGYSDIEVKYLPQGAKIIRCLNDTSK